LGEFFFSLEQLWSMSYPKLNTNQPVVLPPKNIEI
jgi:hypothetical protein